jgi:hypothetical protein
MDFDDVRRIASAFPGIEEHIVFGGPTLKVGKRFLEAVMHFSNPHPLPLSNTWRGVRTGQYSP